MDVTENSATAEAEIRRIAAVLVAIDPERRETRRDILTSAAIDLLTLSGPLSVSALLHALQSDFHTSSLTEPELRDSLLEAKEARLVETLGGSEGEIRWKATPGAEAESKEGHNAAEQVFERFRLQVTSHIDISDFDIKVVQRDVAHLRLMSVLAAGCAKVSGGHNHGAAFLRPVSFDLEAVRAALRRIQPQSLREAISEMAMKAIDPDDPFGNELVHLLVVASVLICFIKKRDFESQPTLSGIRLLIDTQLLVDLVDEGTDEQRIVRNLIDLSLRLGAEIIVAEHNLDEWGRLWDAAEHENPSQLDSHELMGAASRIPTDNPFISQFIRLRERNPTLKWNAFKVRRRDFRRTLTGLGITIRSNGNDEEEDQRLASQMRFTMGELQKGSLRLRGSPGISCDANSAAMVARWRRKYPASPSSAYFVGTDSLIGRAYREIVPTDVSPLAVRSVSWLMYVACLTGDVTDVTEMADVVSSIAVREGFFGVATAYTLEEVLKMSDILRLDHSPMSLEDSREAIQLNLNSLFADMQNATPEQRAIAASAEVMRRRSARNNERARRAIHAAATAKATSETKVVQAGLEANQAGNAKRVVEDQLAESERKLLQSEVRNRRLIRKLRAVGIGITLFAMVIGLILWGVIVHWGIAVAVLSLLYYCLRSTDYVQSNDVTSAKIIREAIVEIVLLLVAIMIKP